MFLFLSLKKVNYETARFINSYDVRFNVYTINLSGVFAMSEGMQDFILFIVVTALWIKVISMAIEVM